MALTPPEQLIELRLVGCETKPRIMKELCRTLNYRGDGDSYLRSLAIVSMKINFPLDDIA